MKHSYLLAGTSFGKLTKLFIRNGISLHPKLLFRSLFLLQNTLWASFFKHREIIKYKKVLESHPVPDDPVIIIGHWRTGSTFLHQLLSLDENLITPSVFQVSVPDSFLVSRKYYQPVMTSMMDQTRPMDNVKLGFDEPQEDEYALIKLTADSPLEYVIFPKSKEYFLNQYENFKPDNKVIWENAIKQFCKKLTFENGKRVVLKNPFHSLRMELLLEIFPNAKFIHTHRHPFKVVPSTINMWNIVARQNRLKGKWTEPKIEDVATVLDKMLDKIRKNLRQLPKEKYCEVSFESFEKDPVSSLKTIYSEIGMDFTNDFEEKVRIYVSQLKSYQKNEYSIGEDEKEIIQKILINQFNYYNYSLK